jgi:hypothetical protein
MQGYLEHDALNHTHTNKTKRNKGADYKVALKKEGNQMKKIDFAYIQWNSEEFKVSFGAV